MTLRELYKKYEGYSFEVFGRPLEQKTIPFTLLPRDKELMDCEVVELKVIDHEFEQHRFELSGKYKGKEIMKGYVRVYVK